MMKSLILAFATAAAVGASADEVPWTYDTSKRTEPVPQSTVSAAVPSLAARNVAVAASAATSALDAWVHSFELLRGLSIDASPRGIVFLIR